MAGPSALNRLWRRGLGAAAALWLVATLSFFSLRLAPGDPAREADPGVPPSQAETLRKLYGLDRPLVSQYTAWLSALVTGDLGWSFHHRRPVSAVVRAALPPTLLLGGLAIALQHATAVVLACLSSNRRRLRRWLGPATTVLYAMPTFWLGLLGLRWLGQDLSWFPTFGAGSSWGSRVHHALLPAAALALANFGLLYQLTTAALVEALDSPYAVAARARGLGEQRLLWRHALPNAAPVLLHRLGLDLPILLSGALVLEVLFSRPGLGRVAHQAFLSRDFPVLAVLVTAAGALVIAGSLLADLAHGLLDPRVRDA